MTKEETLEYLIKKGITNLKTEHPNTPKAWVLEYLNSPNYKGISKEYWREFIDVNFS